MDDLLLAGDIGGTKADLVVVEPVLGGYRVLAERRYATREHASAVELIERFVEETGLRARRMTLSVAGPVLDGRARLSNVGWRFTDEDVREALGLLAVHLLNDLHATAEAVPYLTDHQVVTLHAGHADPVGTRAVIAPGTGLGEAVLIPCGDGYSAFPTEGGHTDFGPAVPEQDALLAFLRAEDGHVSWESVCSGRGIANIHRFLTSTDRAADSESDAAVIEGSADRTRAIVEIGSSGEGDSAAARALDIFVDVLAAESGNLALRALATGGVYIGGGLPPRLRDRLSRPEFVERFRSKGMMADLVSNIPLHLILESRTALWGAVRHGLSRAHRPF